MASSNRTPISKVVIMSGHIGNLNPKQEEALTELKKCVADVHISDYDDAYYLRWLRAREFCVTRAEAMMRKNLLWRKKMGIDTILTDYKPPEVIDKYYPRGVLGRDYEGSPVRILPFGNLDLRGFAFSASKSDIVKFIAYVFETDIRAMEEETKRTGKNIEGYTCIVDIDRYTFTQAMNKQSIDLLNEMLKMNEANYPERLKVAYFINAPQYFWVAFALSRPFLSTATVNKFKVFGRDGYQEELCKIMDPNILPTSLGGNRRDPDGNPRCETVITYGDFVPKSYYFQSDGHFAKEEGVKKICVPKRSSEFLDITVHEPGSRLEWEVKTVDGDLGTALYYAENSSGTTNRRDLKEVLPMEKVNCHLIPESRAFMCEKAGVYVLKFDNHYSWFTSKDVHYRISVHTPSEVTRF